jgi:hypothetical protein
MQQLTLLKTSKLKVGYLAGPELPNVALVRVGLFSISSSSLLTRRDDPFAGQFISMTKK